MKTLLESGIVKRVGAQLSHQGLLLQGDVSMRQADADSMRQVLAFIRGVKEARSS